MWTIPSLLLISTPGLFSKSCPRRSQHFECYNSHYSIIVLICQVMLFVFYRNIVADSGSDGKNILQTSQLIKIVQSAFLSLEMSVDTSGNDVPQLLSCPS